MTCILRFIDVRYIIPKRQQQEAIADVLVATDTTSEDQCATKGIDNIKSKDHTVRSIKDV